MATKPNQVTLGGPYAPNPVQPISFGSDDISLEPILGFFRRHRKLLIVAAVAGAAVGVAASFLVPRTYTARTSFMPQGRVQASALASLAAQFGVGGLATMDA